MVWELSPSLDTLIRCCCCRNDWLPRHSPFRSKTVQHQNRLRNHKLVWTWCGVAGVRTNFRLLPLWTSVAPWRRKHLNARSIACALSFCLFHINKSLLAWLVGVMGFRFEKHIALIPRAAHVQQARTASATAAAVLSGLIECRQWCYVCRYVYSTDSEWYRRNAMCPHTAHGPSSGKFVILFKVDIWTFDGRLEMGNVRACAEPEWFWSECPRCVFCSLAAVLLFFGSCFYKMIQTKLVHGSKMILIFNVSFGKSRSQMTLSMFQSHGISPRTYFNAKLWGKNL